MASSDRVASRLKLRDLRLLEVVVQCGSMAKAASQLHLTQPAVSKAISELEQMFGARLIDRNRHGIEPTVHGRALLRRGGAIFDEVRQGLSEMETLSDPAAGELRLGASPPMAAGLLSHAIACFNRQHPRVSIHAGDALIGILSNRKLAYRDLREREVDLILGPILQRHNDDDLRVEPLFDDPLRVVTGIRNPWARKRKVVLSDLSEEMWCLPPLDSRVGANCVEAFRSNGLRMPKRTITSSAVHLQFGLLATHQYFTLFPGSLVYFSGKRFQLKALPIGLSVQPIKIGIITFKGRTISPAAELFIQAVRETVEPLARALRTQVAK